MNPTPDLDRTFAALADPVRRAIIVRLAAGEATVSELASPFAISLPAISRHLKVLEKADLLVRIPDGQHRRCRLRAAKLREAAEWIDFYRQFWEDSFDRLAEHLREGKANKEQRHGKSRRRRE